MQRGPPPETAADDQRRDRGQLLLVAGLGIAVAFVALALVVNSVVFTHNLATRPSPSGADAMEYQDVVTEGVGGVISEANAREYVGHGALDEAFRNGTTEWANLTLHQYAAQGTLTDVTVTGVTNGTSIHQASVRTFTDRNGTANWSAFDDADGARRFRMNVTDDPGTLTVTTTFADGTTHSVDVDGGTTVTVDGGCSASAPATVDFSRASVDGAHCAALDGFASGTVEEIRFTNGDAVSGRYVVVANATPGSLYASDEYTDHYYTADSNSPYALDAVYAASLNVTYRASDITYRTRVDVRPDVIPQGPRYGVVPLRDRVVFAYANDPTNLSTIDALGGVTRFAPTDAQVIGPREYDFTGDGVLDTPYVDDGGDVRLANESGSFVVATGADHTKSLLAVGSWNGSEPAIYYTDTGDSVYRVRPGESAVAILSDTNSGVSAVVGPGDVDADGTDELVYLGDSQQLRYFESDGTHDPIPNGGVGLNNGIGAGAPVDLNGDGVDRVPMVDGSNNLHLINVNTKEKILSGNVAATPVTAFDVDGDGEREIVYIDNQEVKYVDDVFGSQTRHTFDDSTGGAVVADGQTGVA